MIFWSTTAACLAVLIALLSVATASIAQEPGSIRGFPVALLVLLALTVAAMTSILLALGARRAARNGCSEPSAL